MPYAQQDIVNCHECDWPSALPELAHNQNAHCPRCGYKLAAQKHNHEQAIVALSLTALIFLGFSLPFEFLSFSSQGLSQSMNLPGSIQILASREYLSLATLLLLVIFILPATILLSLFYLYGCHLCKFNPWGANRIAKLIYLFLPWSMVEIFLVGVTVSLIKIVSLADVGLGPSFYSYIGFTVATVATLLYVDKQQLKKRFEVEFAHRPVQQELSIQRTWALLITSLILYIPANLLPIMYTRTLGQDEPSTIMGGVLLLWELGSYPIAAIIFIASVVVPIAKLIILCWLNYSVQKGFSKNPQKRIYWYRVTEFIGRWSMVDVFVVAILVSLIQLGNIMSIYPGPAAMAFCGVVIATMLAAMSFDTRLIWANSRWPSTTSGADKPV
ncbi:paraquat-inducible protein A [uncultured Pseudoteredinibacter sp.]|uniref:paraquat-inducible protein A n=1 Tax=uncultured Pseudoteredinibacter sp. TaxID=1641701 RepID=UPI00260C9CA9|nr:paraquat-inducible protein A [uncultured Pseudoteredinibacter sp.]